METAGSMAQDAAQPTARGTAQPTARGATQPMAQSASQLTVQGASQPMAKPMARGTKELILREALRLFAKDGYEAVSVRDIASKLGMTQGALYKHYASKRDIFDHIVSAMAERDEERSLLYGVPEKALPEAPEAYAETPFGALVRFSEAQFRYWTEDEFAADFRKMITLEQYRNSEMATLYHQHLGSGPLAYTADLLAEMLGEARERGEDAKRPAVRAGRCSGHGMEPCIESDEGDGGFGGDGSENAGLSASESENAQQLALEFYAPLYLLMSVYDAAENKREVARAAQGHIARFAREHVACFEKKGGKEQ